MAEATEVVEVVEVEVDKQTPKETPVTENVIEVSLCEVINLYIEVFNVKSSKSSYLQA